MNPVEFNPDIASDICRRVAGGESLAKVCEDDGYPTRTTVYEWMRDSPQFSNNYAIAKEGYADVVFEDMMGISDNPELDPQRARLMIDTRKWVLGRIKPKKYGDKLAVGGAEDMPPIQTQNQLDVSKLTLEQLEALKAALTGGTDE